MKKIATLILAAGLVFGAATGSSAVEFEAKGQWLMNFEYGAGGGMLEDGRGRKVAGSGYGGANAGAAGDNSDNFDATQRIRLQLSVVASEALSGSVMFEMGNQTWGNRDTGGSLGTDGIAVEVKHAYLDWIVPDTTLKLRMGLQNIALPSYTFNSSQVLNNDSAAIAASYQFNDNVGATFVWARPYNDNYIGAADGSATGYRAANNLDNVDVFALIVPMSFNNVKIAPWVAYAMVGKNSLGSILDQPYVGNVANGLLPATTYANSEASATRDAYGSVFWVGLTGEVSTGSPLRFAWDANYGSSTNGVAAQARTGYYIDALVEYKMDWGTPGLYAWYASGDDDSVQNGSERMPSLSADGNDERSNLAGTGGPYIGREGVIADQWTGTWGVGIRLKDMSFMENLKHTLRVNYMVGTNDKKMAQYMIGSRVYTDGTNRAVGPNLGYGAGGSGFTNANGSYLTTDDSALEVGLTSTYKIYDNLTMYVDLEYLFTFMDESLWNKNGATGNNAGMSFTDPWNINVTFAYDF